MFKFPFGILLFSNFSLYLYTIKQGITTNKKKPKIDEKYFIMTCISEIVRAIVTEGTIIKNPKDKFNSKSLNVSP